MKSLAFDPGTVSTGWSVYIDGIPVQNDKIRAVTNWCQSKRLGYILEGITYLIRTEKPDVVIVEEQHVGRNAKTSLITARAMGVIIATAGLYKIPVYEFKPTEIKKSTTGRGDASKEEVAQALLDLYPENCAIQDIGEYIDKGVKKTDDIYDAAAANEAFKQLGDTRNVGTVKNPKYESRLI